jgi:hypothetical protein
MLFKEELQSMKYTVTDQRCTSFIQENFSTGHLSPVQIENIGQIKSNNPSIISASPFDQNNHNHNTAHHNPNKIIKKAGTHANI